MLMQTQPTTNDLVPAGANVEKLASGVKFIEGPIWIPGVDGGYLVFSDTPSDELKRWDSKSGLTTFRPRANKPNGNTLDREGQLLTCEHGARRLTRTEKDGSITILADNYQGKRLNSPNDVVVKSDGSVWFSDTTYGIEPKDVDLAGRWVFRLSADGKTLEPVVTDFDMPNGLCFSPDEKRLYIADSEKPHHIRVYDVSVDGKLSNSRVFAVIEPGVPDGMRCDERGNLWTSAGDGVHVFSPDGRLLLKIPVPETPANVCFGGEDGKMLFITARTSLYAIRVNVKGATRP